MDQKRWNNAVWAVLLPGILLVSRNLISDEPKASGSYVEQIQQWRTEHEAKFRSPTGWLALVGHYWLEPGTNSFGASADNRIRLPSIPGLSVYGSFELSANRVQLFVEEGTITVNQLPVTTAKLDIDTTEPETNGKDEICIGDRLKLQLVRRNGRFAVRVRDSESPFIKDFKGKEWFDADPSYRVEAKFTRFVLPRTVRIINVKGDETDTKIVGRVEFTLGQTRCQLDAMEDAPDQLFLIFKDLTNGKTTYGAGRFLDVPLTASHDSIILDFNQTYNPPCAFSPHTLCPIPPPQNHLKIAICAGERYSSAEK